MKATLKILTVLTVSLFMSCGDGEKKENSSTDKSAPIERAAPAEKAKTSNADATPASKRIDLTSKGIGPVKSLNLPAEIDQEMAARGEALYKMNCTACHKAEKKFIGPAPKGVLERRTPEWVMNMILNPDEMTQKDPLAKDLLAEFNGSPMANQHLTETQAREILEFFRTL